MAEVDHTRHAAVHVIQHPGPGSQRRRRHTRTGEVQRSTSTLKRDKANVLLTAIVAALGLDRQALVINCLGIRAAESPARSRKLPLSIDARTSNGKRLVLTWHPIFALSDTEIWQEIAAEGLEYHPAYDAAYAEAGDLPWIGDRRGQGV
ncbi:phosphoadenosine phosphosulfate reductase family protein [Streptomyces sp. NPDC057582]|uniref:phosphoadenosine phosphosulfate reductase domain-containing protein n=1 Tax=Streptomyces sp. NPDC057582 TaxID=3346174 RepID=UPI0036C848C5